MSEEPYIRTEKKKEQIQEGYLKWGFPSTTRLTQLMLQSGIKITKEEVKRFLDEQTPQQICKPPQVRRKKDNGAITALFPLECIQIDVFRLFNFIDQWRGSPHKYAFCAIDVFSRKAFGVAMTKKTMAKTVAIRGNKIQKKMIKMIRNRVAPFYLN